MKCMSVPRMRGQFMVQCLSVFACAGLHTAGTRVHVAEAAETLGEALKAPLIRTGV